MFFKRWFDQNILFVTQLLNENGHLYNYTEFLKKYAVPITPNEFAIIFDAIPAELLMLLRGDSRPQLNVHLGKFNVISYKFNR